jgi:hypothetical protein
MRDGERIVGSIYPAPQQPPLGSDKCQLQVKKEPSLLSFKAKLNSES